VESIDNSRDPISCLQVRGPSSECHVERGRHDVIRPDPDVCVDEAHETSAEEDRADHQDERHA
jgi:hypothetical protein